MLKYLKFLDGNRQLKNSRSITNMPAVNTEAKYYRRLKIIGVLAAVLDGNQFQ
ncbi:MAG: hypothetical protein WAO83_13990 [Fuerstiella sp.]